MRRKKILTPNHANSIVIMLYLCFLSNVVARIISVLLEKIRDFRRWGAAATLAPQLIRLSEKKDVKFFVLHCFKL